MTDAVHAMVAEIQRVHGDVAIDVIGVSLSSEYAARAAQEAPARFSQRPPWSARPASTAARHSMLPPAATAASPGCAASSSTPGGVTGFTAG